MVVKLIIGVILKISRLFSHFKRIFQRSPFHPKIKPIYQNLFFFSYFFFFLFLSIICLVDCSCKNDRKISSNHIYLSFQWEIDIFQQMFSLLFQGDFLIETLREVISFKEGFIFMKATLSKRTRIQLMFGMRLLGIRLLFPLFGKVYANFYRILWTVFAFHIWFWELGDLHSVWKMRVWDLVEKFGGFVAGR